MESLKRTSPYGSRRQGCGELAPAYVRAPTGVGQKNWNTWFYYTI